MQSGFLTKYTKIDPFVNKDYDTLDTEKGVKHFHFVLPYIHVHKCPISFISPCVSPTMKPDPIGPAVQRSNCFFISSSSQNIFKSPNSLHSHYSLRPSPHVPKPSFPLRFPRHRFNNICIQGSISTRLNTNTLLHIPAYRRRYI